MVRLNGKSIKDDLLLKWFFLLDISCHKVYTEYMVFLTEEIAEYVYFVFYWFFLTTWANRSWR